MAQCFPICYGDGGRTRGETHRTLQGIITLIEVQLRITSMSYPMDSRTSNSNNPRLTVADYFLELVSPTQR